MHLIRKPLRFCLLWIEAALDRVFGPAWNPFYSLGALGYFYYWVVLASGIYLFIFFDTGITEAYGSVEYLTREQWWLGGVMRSLHRYASDALVAMMLLHLAREFAYDRYRGHRWYSWVTGVPVLWLVFIAGITGYWLVWDTLAQYVAVATAEWLDWLPIFGEPVARNFMAPSHLDDRFFTLMVFMHIAVPLILIFLLWFHLHRVSHARVNPARGLAVGTFLMLLGLSIVKPAVSHPPADLATVPTVVNLDWFYLWAFPLVDLWSPGPMWAFAVGGSFLMMLVPWLPPKRRNPVAVVNLDNCNGCGRCADDCPFNAISMGRRTDGLPFDRQAVVHPSTCASCGICVGSCPTATPFRRVGALVPGIDLPHLSLARLRDLADAALAGLAGPARVLVFGCEHGANAGKLGVPGVGWVAMPCTAMLPPSFVDYALSRDRADGVVVQSCSEGHCNYRLGVRWTDARLEGRRDPGLRARVPRERLLRVTAEPTEWRRLERELQAFQERLGGLARERAQAPGAEAPGAVSPGAAASMENPP